MSNIKEAPILEREVDIASANVDASAIAVEPHILPPPIPDPIGIALLLLVIIGVSELGRAAIRGKT